MERSLFPPPTLGKRRHRVLARGGVAVGRRAIFVAESERPHRGHPNLGAKDRLHYILINVEVSPSELRTTSSFCLNISIVLVAVLFTTFASSALSMFKLITLPLTAIHHLPKSQSSCIQPLVAGPSNTPRAMPSGPVKLIKLP